MGLTTSIGRHPGTGLGLHQTAVFLSAGPCAVEEDVQWAGGGPEGLLRTPQWPMHPLYIQQRDALVARLHSGVTVIEGATVDDLSDLYDEDGWLAGPSATRAPRGDRRVLFHHNDAMAMWEDGVLVGDEQIVNTLWAKNESEIPVLLGADGPAIVPDLNSHIGAWACGVAAGFKLTGDLPTGVTATPKSDG